MTTDNLLTLLILGGLGYMMFRGGGCCGGHGSRGGHAGGGDDGRDENAAGKDAERVKDRPA